MPGLPKLKQISIKRLRRSPDLAPPARTTRAAAARPADRQQLVYGDDPAWGETLDNRHPGWNRCRSDFQPGQDTPSVMVQLTAESQRMGFHVEQMPRPRTIAWRRR